MGKCGRLGRDVGDNTDDWRPFWNEDARRKPVRLQCSRVLWSRHLSRALVRSGHAAST